MSSFLADKHIFDLVAPRFGFFVEEKDNIKSPPKNLTYAIRFQAGEMFFFCFAGGCNRSSALTRQAFAPAHRVTAWAACAPTPSPPPSPPSQCFLSNSQSKRLYPVHFNRQCLLYNGPLQRNAGFLSLMHCVFIYGINLCNILYIGEIKKKSLYKSLPPLEIKCCHLRSACLKKIIKWWKHTGCADASILSTFMSEMMRDNVRQQVWALQSEADVKDTKVVREKKKGQSTTFSVSL